MNEQQLNAIAQFMQRVDLKPAEIPAWQEAMQGLGMAVQELREQQQQPPQKGSNPFEKEQSQ